MGGREKGRESGAIGQIFPNLNNKSSWNIVILIFGHCNLPEQHLRREFVLYSSKDFTNPSAFCTVSHMLIYGLWEQKTLLQ